MTVKNLVGTLTRTGVSTAISVVRHPIGTTALAAGLVKGTAEASASLVRSTFTGHIPAPRGDIEDRDVAEVATAAAVEPASAPTETVEADPRDHIPGPELAAFDTPAPEDLPEPIAIVADARVEEAFHTDPEAASPDSADGGPAGDREEIEGYAEEIVLDDLEVETDPYSPAAAPSRE